MIRILRAKFSSFEKKTVYHGVMNFSKIRFPENLQNNRSGNSDEKKKKMKQTLEIPLHSFNIKKNSTT